MLQRRSFNAFLIGSILMLPVFFGRDGVIGNDSPYHLVMARYLSTLAMADAFPWLHWTIFRESFVNHHLGFQVLLAPFAYLSDRLTGDLMPGGQAAVIATSGLTALCLYRVLALLRVPCPLLWILLMGIFPWHYWMRQGYVRAPIVALPMMLIAVELIIRRRPVLLGMVALGFMLVYFGAVLFGVVVACMLAGFIIVEGVNRKTVIMALSTAAGLGLGFIVHPSFPENIAFMKIQLFDSGFSAAADIGSEWKPPSTRTALAMWAPLLGVWGFALVSRLKSGGKAGASTIGLLILAVAFLMLSLMMRRFVEYAPAFALLSAASLAGFDPDKAAFLRPGFIRKAALAALIMLAFLGPLTARSRAKPSFETKRIQHAMEWLIANSPAGSMVFTDDWDLFPRCFYFNRHNTYAVGLDPMFTARPYPGHWRRYRMITRGKAPLRAGPDDNVSMEDIRQLFSADYVLVMDDHSAFYRRLAAAEDQFEKVFPGTGESAQPPVAIFRVKLIGNRTFPSF